MPSHPEHLQGFNYLGPHRYSLRFCTDCRRRIFVSADVVNMVWSHILRAATEESFAVIAYCFMPDHLHLLADGEAADSDLNRFVARAKQYSGFDYAKDCQQQLWQRYCYERVLRSDEATWVVARYILENPVRAGLVTDVRDYPFVGSAVYALDQLLEGVSQVSRSG